MFNKRWDSRSAEWYTPTDFVSFTDSKIFTSEISKSQLYFRMLYQSVINLGIGELGPVNEEEMAFFFISMLLSTLMTNLIFGEVYGLISSINLQENLKQNELDFSNNVMKQINLSFESIKDVHAYFRHTEQSHMF